MGILAMAIGWKTFIIFSVVITLPLYFIIVPRRF